MDTNLNLPESDKKRVQFGNRYLDNLEDVFQHNAW